MAGGPLETGLIGGAEKREIKIVDDDADWPKKFATADFAQYRKLGSTVKAPVEQLWREVKARHDAWAHLGGNDFAYTTIEDLFDAMGSFAGTTTVRVRLSITGPDTYVGVANAEQRDAAGNLVANRCSTLRGERIKVEPRSPQCQSITPPQ